MLDVIGYDYVPEPGSATTCLLAAALTLGRRRRSCFTTG